jgi:tRNA-specific adenosine deaminase 3
MLPCSQNLDRWIQQPQTLEDDLLSHLKRVRKHPTTGSTSILLAPCTSSSISTDEPLTPPTIPPSVASSLSSTLSAAYVITVPTRSATTLSSLALKNMLWPTVYAPSRKNEPEVWTRAQLVWACDAIGEMVRIAKEAGQNGNLPIAAYAPVPYKQDKDKEKGQKDVSAVASADAVNTMNLLNEPVFGIDTRKQTGHPLRHAVFAAVRALADRQGMASVPIPTGNGPSVPAPLASESKNGSHYLLTGLTLFLTHEPCIMCSMALLHSRVKEVIFLRASPGTGGLGGCGAFDRGLSTGLSKGAKIDTETDHGRDGGDVDATATGSASAACVPALEGVNHRYGIMRLNLDRQMEKSWWESVHEELQVPDGVDI